LCDCRDSEAILTSTFHKTEEELGTIFVLHDVPCLIYNEHALTFTRASNVPDIVEEDIHGDRAEDIIEISNREDDESILEIDIGGL
jgi:hypothetical protein